MTFSSYILYLQYENITFFKFYWFFSIDDAFTQVHPWNQKDAKNKDQNYLLDKLVLTPKGQTSKKGWTQSDTQSVTSTVITCPFYYQSTLIYLTIFNLLTYSIAVSTSWFMAWDSYNYGYYNANQCCESD